MRPVPLLFLAVFLITLSFSVSVKTVLVEGESRTLRVRRGACFIGFGCPIGGGPCNSGCKDRGYKRGGCALFECCCTNH
ncbi:unnamed protein product [Adineta ricciae]|uniref:Uncharacterized protein n=1 Tax=Adineta ricciae TaxID=249248 RepID=A0A814R9Z6_ADIRI|nr:unnamed protein product [Adineta ricciae]CAF1413517.1 unnamed protein product [Adineta ricciae]